MVSTFDMEKLNTFLRDFNLLTGIRITIFDDSYTEITSYPRDIAPVCRYIRSDRSAEAACRKCDRSACEAAANRKGPYIYRCHAGLTEAVAPVFMGNIIVSYLLFGHLFSYPDKKSGVRQVRSICQKYSLEPDILEKHLDSLEVISEEYILSAANILRPVASFLCLERLITLKKPDPVVEIDAYLSEHFAEKIDIDGLCERFQVGKTKLYEIAKQNYGMGIAEHIRTLRIEHAKKLLVSGKELSINAISEQCGFDDYNYFITVFKRLTGTTPKKYREQAI